ncbi:uncharacterized protein GLRG_11693 [Colletotrichum graminicola M1.001]|uniref:Secreted protein n=1 Tax=Colletotrichum graminicola (strain M1.001 / M2 / FGSC 10212) TaxID=645133 RepID=E3R0B0_COLGM|nr:uncharacterized protein GLRG_11693 [Colletotrichum graminicola M1.001]EFQ36548.1 hypothetical protein GLRG_11693 [Colletotrichum graminicola M1.001]
MSMPAVKLLLVVTIPLSAPHPPSDAFTRSQNSVFALQQTIGAESASNMDVLKITSSRSSILGRRRRIQRVSLRPPLLLHVVDGQSLELVTRRHSHLAGLLLRAHAV